MYTELIDLIKTFPGHKIEWQDKLRVKGSPHTGPIDIYGLTIYGVDIVMCIDVHGNQWNIADNDKIAGSLLQRLKLIKHEASKTEGQDLPSTILT